MTSKEFGKLSPEHRAILEKHISEFLTKLGQLARELGISLKVAALRTGVSGQITNDDGTYVVRVNRHEARERQRFTIAHEIAHYLLHKDIIDSSADGITDTVLYRSGAPERVEYEANRLAADIVMPMALIQQLLDNEFGGIVTEVTIANLAERFQVSKAAMEIRLSSFVEA